MLCLPVPIYTPLPWPGENFPQPDIGAVCPFSGNGAEMQRNTGYFPTESLEPSGNRLFSRSALNEGYLFRGSLESQCSRFNTENNPSALVDDTDFEWLMIDASHCKVHPHAAGARGGNQDMSRTKGGSTPRYIWPWMRMVCRCDSLSLLVPQRIAQLQHG